MAPSSFCVSAPGRGQPTADPGGGGPDGSGGGEQSRRHRPMVQSSRGWDEAPRSGWGVKPSAPSTRKGARPLLEAARAPRPCSAGFGAARPVSPARSLPRAPRAARMPRRPCAPLLPSRVGWAGTAVGLPARRAAVGRAGVRRPGPVRGVAARVAVGSGAGCPARVSLPPRPRRCGEGPGGSVCKRGGGLGRAEAEDLQSWRGRALLELMLKQGKSGARLLRSRVKWNSCGVRSRRTKAAEIGCHFF